jgi:hypothetical protein
METKDFIRMFVLSITFYVSVIFLGYILIIKIEWGLWKHVLGEEQRIGEFYLGDVSEYEIMGTFLNIMWGVIALIVFIFAFFLHSKIKKVKDLIKEEP